MAGNKINTKNKGKEEKGKTSKGVNQVSEDIEDPDFAQLRKPILTSITGFAQARKIFDFATEELKDLLSNECDLLYECKVCRNIFRSLANFISHKRVYCKEKFNSSTHSHFIKTTSTVNEILKIKNIEDGYQESMKNKVGTETLDTVEDSNERIPLSKDLTTIIEKITKSKGIHTNNCDDHQMTLKKIPSSTIAVFQNVDFCHDKESDNMRAEIKELDNLLSRDKAVLQSDGKFTIESSKSSEKASTDPDNIIQISDDEEMVDGDILKCKICDLQFSTQKTLKFHMKYKHLESRLVYPCPDCLEIFSTSWSVYRHLFKVHRKTAAQIRRLRESIQAKAFRMNNPPAFYEKRKNTMKPVTTQKMTEEERLDQENQAWMDNMEGDGEVPRCGGCGRTFERRAALAAHTHTCQPRSRALARRPEGKKIEIQIRKDYNKGPVSGLTILKYDSNDNKLPTIEDAQALSKLENDSEKDAEDDEKDEEAPMDIGEDDQKSNDSSESPEKMAESQNDFKPVIRLPFAVQAEKSNLAAFKQRIQSDIESLKLICKKCDIKCSSILELYEHMAGHFKWMRYACKLCNYKHYNFEKLPEHVKVVHKLKGDTDFYFSTVKAINGTDAMIISRCLVESESTDEANDANEISPESRRPSRCSSDSSRLSDDSSSSSTLKESSTRKRKLYQNKCSAKRKKECMTTDDGEEKDGDLSMDKAMKVIGEKESSTNIKSFEENSSDLDDIEDRISKRHIIVTSSVASRRPVRKKTKPKNEDFEYDLSNLLKMEAQGYRDSQSVTSSKTNQGKKKIQQESNYDNINKDCCGALVTLSKKTVDNGKAHMKTINLNVYSMQQKDRTSSSIFVRPMLPKIISRSEKGSPKKDVTDDSSLSKVTKSSDPTSSPIKETTSNKSPNEECVVVQTVHKDNIKTLDSDDEKIVDKDDGKIPDKDDNVKTLQDDVKTLDNDDTKTLTTDADGSSTKNELKESDSISVDKVKTNVNNIPAVVPIKFRRQSIELMKNPIINKNITDFTKAGMKTKILVIKPINRNKDGSRAVNAPLKFQTIKLKDPNKGSSTSEDKSPDQVVVVKVPKVDRAIPRIVSDTEKLLSSNNVDSAIEKVEKCDENEVIENKVTEKIIDEINNVCDGNESEHVKENSESVTCSDKTKPTEIST